MKLKILTILSLLCLAFTVKSQSPAVYGKTSFGLFPNQYSTLGSIGLEIVGKSRFTISPRFGVSHIFTVITYDIAPNTNYFGYEGGLKFGLKSKDRKSYAGLDFAMYLAENVKKTSGEFIFAPTIFFSGPSIFKKVDIGANIGPAYSLDAESFGVVTSIFLAYKFL